MADRPQAGSKRPNPMQEARRLAREACDEDEDKVSSQLFIISYKITFEKNMT